MLNPSLPAATAAPAAPNVPTAPAAALIAPAAGSPPAGGSEELREAFGDFVGQTLFGTLMSSMRQSVGKPAYMHGGRTEEVFQQQLDQRLVAEIADASREQVADPLFELFQMQRR